MNHLQSPLLLVMRLYWGWNFFLAGRGKLMNIDRTAGFFSRPPHPASASECDDGRLGECFGGLLLLLGLGSHVITVPLIFTMIIAYVTAEHEALNAIFSNPDKFVSAAPFEFMLTAIIVLVFGPGKLSLDCLIAKKCCNKMSKPPQA